VDNSHPFVIGVRADGSGQPMDTDVLDLIEMPGSAWRLGSAYRETCKRLTYGVRIGKFLRRKNLADDLDLVATFGYDPTKQVWFNIIAEGVGAAASGTVRVVGYLDYEVMLIQPRKVTSS